MVPLSRVLQMPFQSYWGRSQAWNHKRSRRYDWKGNQSSASSNVCCTGADYVLHVGSKVDWLSNPRKQETVEFSVI